MTSQRSHIGPRRIVLIVLLAIAVVVLGVAVAITLPILTHQSAGGSGQRVPDSFVSQVTAEGADGRTRVLSLESVDGGEVKPDELTPGEQIIVRGSGFDAGIGIYIGVCGIPAEVGEKPEPCLGGIPEGAMQGEAEGAVGSSAWITDDWAWRTFATGRWEDAKSGSFVVRLIVPEPTVDGFDCRTSRCAVATRADHTASGDRVQDMLIPIAYAKH